MCSVLILRTLMSMEFGNSIVYYGSGWGIWRFEGLYGISSRLARAVMDMYESKLARKLKPAPICCEGFYKSCVTWDLQDTAMNRARTCSGLPIL